VWDANYVAVYHMNDVTTSTIKDSTSNANNGTKKGANEPIQADGKIGKAQDFDGSNDHIDIPADLGYATIFSVFAWFKREGTTLGQYQIITGDGHCEMDVVEVGGGEYGYIRTGFFTNTPPPDTRYVSNHAGGLSNGTWHYIGFVINGSNKLSYIDGNLVGTFPYSGTPTAVTYRTIGRYGMSTSYYANGKIDEVSFSKISRSADWIKTEYNNQNSPASYLTLGAETCSILADYGMVYSDTLTMSDSEVRDFSSITSDSFPIIDTLVDSLKVEFIAAILDTFSISDSFLAGVGAAISDTMGFSDAYIKGVSSVTSDVLSISDSHTKGVSIPLTDSLSISDIVAKGIGIPISDTLLMHEAITKGVGVVVTDSFSIIDSFVKNELRKLIVKSKFKQGKKYTSTSES
jgi:hypothetical protein